MKRQTTDQNYKRMSLKESHRKKMLLAEKHERDLIIAEATANMLLEVLDSKDLADATKVLKKLNAIAKVSPPILAAAIKEAAAEVNEFTGGGLGAMMKKATTWLAKKFGAKAGTNPILKALTLLNSLELGLSNAVDLINNNAPDYDGNSDKSLMDQIDDTAAKNLRKNLAKAFQPEGVFAKIKSLFGSTGGIPYVKDVDKMVEEIMMLPAKQITSLISAATSGESSEAAVEAAKDMATAGKESNKTATAKSNEPVKSADDLASAIAKGQTQGKGDEAATKAAEQAASNPKVVVKQLVDFVSKQSKQNADVVEKVLNALLKKGKLRASLTTEGRARISVHDVVDAQMALLECGGSSRAWARLLVEKLTAKQKNAIRDIEAKLASGEIKDEKGIEKLLKPVFGSAPKEQMNKLKKKIKSGGPEDKKPETPATEPAADAGENTSGPTGSESDSSHQGAGKEEPATTGGEQPAGNHAEVIKSIQDDLKDVDVKSIEAVLDALPEYLRLESLKHYLGVI